MEEFCEKFSTEAYEQQYEGRPKKLQKLNNATSGVMVLVPASGAASFEVHGLKKGGEGHPRVQRVAVLLAKTIKVAQAEEEIDRDIEAETAELNAAEKSQKTVRQQGHRQQQQSTRKHGRGKRERCCPSDIKQRIARRLSKEVVDPRMAVHFGCKAESSALKGKMCNHGFKSTGWQAWTDIDGQCTCARTAVEGSEAATAAAAAATGPSSSTAAAPSLRYMACLCLI